MQTKTFSIKQAFLSPFRMIKKYPRILLSLLAMLGICSIPLVAFIFAQISIIINAIGVEQYAFIAQQANLTGIDIYTLLAQHMPHLSTILKVTNQIFSTVFTVSLVLGFITVALSYYRTGKGSLRFFFSKLKHLPIFTLIMCVYLLPTFFLHWAITLSPLHRFFYIAAHSTYHATLARFGLFPYFLIEKENGFQSLSSSWRATANNTGKMIIYILLFVGTQHILPLTLKSRAFISLLSLPILVIAIFADLYVYTTLTE